MAEITPDRVVRAQARPEYRLLARELLLGPIEAAADAQAVFAAMLLVFDTLAGTPDWKGVMPRGEVADWLRSEKVLLSDDRFDACWRLIAGTGLVDLAGDGGGAELCRQQGGYMAIALAGNREQYFRRAASRLTAAGA